MNEIAGKGRGMRRTVAALALALAQAAVQAQATPQPVDGQAVFRARCAVCHGVNADGLSDLARIMRPPPANLRASQLNDAQQSEIVRRGGEAVGRSPNMPEWRAELTEAEVVAVLAYLRTVRGVHP